MDELRHEGTPPKAGSIFVNEPSADDGGDRALSSEETVRVYAGSRRKDAILLILTLIVAALAFGAWRSDRALSVEVAHRQQRTIQMAADTARIIQLRGIPQAVREAGASETWILERVTNAMQAAGITPQQLVSTAPQPARPLEGTELREVTQSLELENVSLGDLTRFSAALRESKPIVRISELQLRARPGASNWNAELGVSCLTTAAQSGLSDRLAKNQQLGY